MFHLCLLPYVFQFKFHLKKRKVQRISVEVEINLESLRKHKSPWRGTKLWHRFAGELVESPSLGLFKSCLDVVLGTWLQVVLLEQGCGWGDFQSSLPTSTFCDFCEEELGSRAFIFRWALVCHYPRIMCFAISSFVFFFLLLALSYTAIKAFERVVNICWRK